jgi:hypothetical protein
MQRVRSTEVTEGKSHAKQHAKQKLTNKMAEKKQLVRANTLLYSLKV